MRVDQYRCFKKSGRILYKEIDGAGVLIDPYRRTLIHLNATSLRIWQLLDGNNSCETVIEALRAEFESEDKDLEKDVVSFIKELLKREMIE
jgi:hypothetical protein